MTFSFRLPQGDAAEKKKDYSFSNKESYKPTNDFKKDSASSAFISRPYNLLKHS